MRCVFSLVVLALLAGIGLAARAAERRSFSKASPVEVAFADTHGRCFVHELASDHAIEVDPFICEQLGAEEQRREDLRRLRYVRPAPTETSSSGY